MTRDDLPEDGSMTRLGSVLHTEADRYEPSAGSLARIRERAPARADARCFDGWHRSRRRPCSWPWPRR